jgi:DNA adenine methylase
LNLLRWAGGKSRAACKIVDYIPNGNKVCVSPFFGGGSVEFLLKTKGWKIYAYDASHSLICFWKYVQNNPLELKKEVQKFFPLTKLEFREIQDKLISYEIDKIDNVFTAAYFYVLNRSSFSGTTLSGGMSPGFARFNQKSIDKLEKFSIYLNNISFKCADFQETIPNHSKDFLFCDPPYWLSKEKSNLYGINGNLHRFFDHQKLYELLSSRQNWILCYNDCQTIRNLYQKYEIIPLSWKYGLGNSKTSKEILIRNIQ